MSLLEVRGLGHSDPREPVVIFQLVAFVREMKKKAGTFRRESSQGSTNYSYKGFENIFPEKIWDQGTQQIKWRQQPVALQWGLEKRAQVSQNSAPIHRPAKGLAVLTCHKNY